MSNVENFKGRKVNASTKSVNSRSPVDHLILPDQIYTSLSICSGTPIGVNITIL